MARVLNFTYYFYIDHGFILVDGDHTGNPDKIKATMKKYNINNRTFAVGYPFALLTSLILTGISMFVGCFWYIMLPVLGAIGLIILPSIIIKYAAKEKRNKVIFDTKLDGSFPDESH